MMYIGNIGEKISIRAKYIGRSSYTTYLQWKEINKTVFKFVDDEDNLIIWDTTGWMEDKHNSSDITKGSILDIKATIKAHQDYKGTPQTVLSRPTFTIVELAKTFEEIKEEKVKAQLGSLKEGDFVWEMPYRQYKEHYEDCETIFDSFKNDNNGCYTTSTIEVIIRAGRMKESGVRGKHFKTYFLANKETQARVSYSAISEENALKRALREFPQVEWYCYKVL